MWRCIRCPIACHEKCVPQASSAPPDWSDSDDCEDDYDTIRAIQPVFAAYSDGFYVEQHWWNYAEGDRNVLGILSPELARLSYMEILDFMWNSIGGSIPKEIGDISYFKLLPVKPRILRKAS